MNKKNYGKRSIDDLSLNDRWLRLSILRKLLAGFAGFTLRNGKPALFQRENPV
jgi:hypothetical protein